jgi:hopanoid biosynthesis associated protein HpnK
MASVERRRRLIVTADDFGASTSINQAVLQAHQQGILTCASLMVNGEAFEEAVEIARACPRLGVGLHLTLCCGRATLRTEEIPDLVNEDATLPRSAVAAGFAYYFSRGLRAQLAKEIAAQFEKFQSTRLMMDHVNGHLHFHLHPTVLRLVIPEMKKRGVRAMRLTNDPLKIDRKLGRSRWWYRQTHGAIFQRLSKRARPLLMQEGIAHTGQVFGLLQDTRVTEDYLLKLLPELPEVDSEVYSHPSLDKTPNEYEALVSPSVRAMIEERGIERIRYQDL